MVHLSLSSENSSAQMNGVNSTVINKDAATSIRTATLVASSSIYYPQSKRSFQISAHEVLPCVHFS